MKMKLTIVEWFYVFFGFPYLLNANTGEVHYLPNKTKHCWINLMNQANKVYLSKKQFNSLNGTVFNGVAINGCKWCLKKHDTG